MTGAALLDGHVLLADWLFVIAAVLFVLHFVLVAAAQPDRMRGGLLALGLALVAVGWLVL